MICQSGFCDGEMLGVLPCGHRFHENCVMQGLRYSPYCPTCKHDVTDTSVASKFVYKQG